MMNTDLHFSHITPSDNGAKIYTSGLYYAHMQSYGLRLKYTFPTAHFD